MFPPPGGEYQFNSLNRTSYPILSIWPGVGWKHHHDLLARCREGVERVGAYPSDYQRTQQPEAAQELLVYTQQFLFICLYDWCVFLHLHMHAQIHTRIHVCFFPSYIHLFF